MNRIFIGRVVPLVAAAAIALSACGSDGSAGADDSSAPGGSGLSVPAKKIGVLVTSLQSESLATFANDTKKAAEILGWETVIADGQNNPQVWSTQATQLVTQKVDAIITMGIDAPTITPALQAAQAANIPVIATNVSVAPSGKELFTAVYSDDDEALGKALVDYALEKEPGATAVGQTATAVYAADLLVQSAKRQLDANGGSMAEIQDVDVTNLAPSFGETAVSLVQGNPEASYLISCCDFSPAIDLPALQQANLTGATLMTRYDNASSMKFIDDGAPLVVVASNGERTMLQALDSLAAYFVDGTEIPATYPGDDFQLTVVDKSTMPPLGTQVYPFADMLSSFSDKWSAEYGD